MLNVWSLGHPGVGNSGRWDCKKETTGGDLHKYSVSGSFLCPSLFLNAVVRESALTSATRDGHL